MVYDKSQCLGSHLENCPPDDAKPANGTVYYLVKHNPPIKKDFEPKALRDPKSVKHVPLEVDDPDVWRCETYGISVFTNPKEALEIQNYNYFRDWQLAVANLTSICGLIKKTPREDKRSHHTLWVFKDIEIWNMFSIF